MRVLAVNDGERLAVCVAESDCPPGGGRPREGERLRDGQRRLTVDTGIVGPVAPGDTLLVHAGTALTREPA
jgi:hypothetical protein